MSEFENRHPKGLSAPAHESLLHELRQPLSVIESIAYYLELTASDEKVRVQVRRIQAMVGQANSILEGRSEIDTKRIS